ncbi:MAG: hypothetical protein HY275_16115 [Gemmatimonadetes bacterium]|nr:hypothetical protein [Gemmatimonadota bacterium]
MTKAWHGTWVLLLATSVAGAQQPSPPAKGGAKSDSAAKAEADSIALMKKFEEMQAANAQAPRAQPAPAGGAVGPTNPRMLPDFSAVGDLIADLTKERSTQPDQTRFGVREVELAVQAVVDPYFRGDVFLGINDQEKISIEQAFLTTTALPWGLQAQLGRFLMPVGKQNTTHRHDLHTIEYPYALQRFLSDDGLKGTGVSLSKIFSPFGFYQEIIVTAVDRFGERPDTLTASAPANQSLTGLGGSARLRNYVDFSEAANLEFSASVVTGRREQPLSGTFAGGLNAIALRQTVVGGDVTFRWKPLQQGLYQSLIVQGEFMQQLNQRPDASAVPAGLTYLGPTGDYSGGYLFARWQLTQRLYLGGRYDNVEDPTAGGARLEAESAVLEWFPSEFSKLIAQIEHVAPPGAQPMNRLLLQATFAIGPHKPHPF